MFACIHLQCSAALQLRLSSFLSVPCLAGKHTASRGQCKLRSTAPTSASRDQQLLNRNHPLLGSFTDRQGPEEALCFVCAFLSSLGFIQSTTSCTLHCTGHWSSSYSSASSPPLHAAVGWLALLYITFCCRFTSHPSKSVHCIVILPWPRAMCSRNDYSTGHIRCSSL